MAFLLCQRFTSGPNCSDKRKESTPAEKEDCFIEVIYRMHADYNNCVARKYLDMRQVNVQGADCPTPGCLDDFACLVNSSWREQISACYCTGMSGMTCSMCDDERSGSGGGGVVTDGDKPLEVDRSAYKLATSVTASSYDMPIPLIYGTVTLSGNIIWMGNYEVITKREYSVTGGKAQEIITEEGSMDMLVGFTATQVRAIRRIWFDAELIYTVADDNTVARNGLNTDYNDIGITLMDGRESQRVFTKMTDTIGFGKTPAYRGLTTVMFSNFPLRVSQGSIPLIRVEFVVGNEGSSVTTISSALPYTLNSDSLAMDHTGARAAVSAGDGDIRIVDTDTMVELAHIPVTGTLAEGSAIYSEAGELLYLTTDNRLHYLSSDRIFTFSGAVPGVGLLGVTRVATATGDSFLTVSMALNNDIYVYKVDTFAQQFVLEYTHTDVSTAPIDKFVVGDMGGFNYIGTFASVVKNAMSFSKNDRFVATAAVRLTSETAAYSPESIRKRDITRLMWGGDMTVPVVEIRDVVLTPDPSMNPRLIIFIEDMRGKYACAWSPMNGAMASTLATLTGDNVSFNGPIDHLPALNTCRNPVALNSRTSFAYFGDDNDTLYSMDTSKGEPKALTTLSANGANALGGAYAFNGAKDKMTYIDATGQLCTITLHRVAALDTSVGQVLRDLSRRAGAPLDAIDTRAIDDITFNGFIIPDQSPIGSLVAELADFFQLSIKESMGKITGNPLGAAINTNLNANDVLNVEESRETELVDVDSVTVTYYDPTLDGQATTQQVSRDFFAEFDDFTSNLGEVSVTTHIYASANVARVAAERILLKAIQRQKKYQVLVGPKHMAIEPGDYIQGGYRVSAATTDVTFQNVLQAQLDDASIYNQNPDIEGFVRDPGKSSYLFDAVGTVKGFPHIINGPTFEYNPATERVYISLFNPDEAEFAPTALHYRGLSGTFIKVGTPTKEALLGRLVSLPHTTTAVFGTDKISELVVTFVKDVEASDFLTITDDRLYSNGSLNMLFVGKEAVQYKRFSIDPDNRTVRFTHLLRGRWGTDRHTDEHIVGEVVTVYDANATLPVNVTNDVAYDKTVVGAVFDPIYPSVRREVEASLTSRIDDFWLPHDLDIRKAPSNGIYLRAFARIPYGNSVFAGTEGNMIGFTNSNVVAAAVLNGPYDPVAFKAALATPETSPYFAKFFFDVSSAASPTAAGGLWTNSSMSAAGYTFDDDLTIAFFGRIPPTGKYSKPRIVHFPAHGDYTKFREGRDA